MSKEICIDMWVSIIPNKLYDSWVKRKFIKRGANQFSEAGRLNEDSYVDTWEKNGERDWKVSVTKEEAMALKKDGWKLIYHTFLVKEDHLKVMHIETGLFYKEVFLYVDEWLRKHGFIDLKKGSFRGGFVATSKEDDTTKAWGAPLAGPENKVLQIKEKFGNIVVYFGGLTTKERTKINRFAKQCENKFDCVCCFH